MKKLIALALVFVCVVFLFIGCNKNPAVDTQPGQQTPVNTQPQTPNNTLTPDQPAQTTPATEAPTPATEAPTPHVRVTREEEVARDFIDALLKKDYEKVISLFECSVDGGTDFVFPADVEWALPRSDFKDLSYFDAATAEYTTELNSYTGNVDVTVKDAAGEQQTFTVKVKIPDGGDGSPMVDGLGQFYFRNFQLRTSGGAKLEIEGVEAGPSMIKQRGSGKYGLVNDWLFPVIGVKPKSMRLYCESFDETQIITPVSNNQIAADDNNYRFEADLTEDDAEAALQGVVELWNSMYAAATAEGANANAISPWIASDAAPDTSTTLFEALTSLPSQYPSQRNHKMTQISYRDGSAAPFWFSDNHAGINFNYELTWETKYGNSWESGKVMRRQSSMILAREDGVWKVFFVSDLPLFNYTNHTTKQW